MTIKIKEKPSVLAIPSRSLVTDDHGDRTVRVVTNTRTKKYNNVPVVTGLEGDGGVVEILKGLSVGEEFVILIK
jgi:multidrug efflux pump subunit AcrA (membrane-fusion protein)